MTDIVWEDPPPKLHGGGLPPVWAGRLAPLRERPGQWAKMGTYRASIITDIRGGYFSGIERGEYEAEGRNFDSLKKTVTLYVRYVGGQS